MKKLNIKKYVLNTLIVLAALPLASCADFLDKEPDTEVTIEMVFENRTKIYDWLANCYNVIHTLDKWYHSDEGYEIFADDITVSERWEQWSYGEQLHKIFGQWTINSTWAGNFWAGLPELIRQCYIFNENIHALDDPEITKDEVELMKVETRFLAAYAWWLLAYTYGATFFRPDYIAPTDFDLEDLMQGQVPFDEVVEYCDAEMMACADALPAVYSKPEKYGRINKIMALTIRSRMLLFAASPLVNGNYWYANYTNNVGELVFNPTYDHNKWIKAAEACKLCIDEAEAAGHELYVEYAPSGAIDPYMSTYNVQIKKWAEGNKEITFPVTRSHSYIGRMLYGCSVRDLGGGSGLGVYQCLVDAFFMRNGLPIDDPNSGYDYDTESELSSSVETDDTYWEHGTGVAGEITDAGTFKMYCNREPRFYNAVSYNGAWNTVMDRKFDFYWNGADNIRSSSPHDAPQNGYLCRKGICMTDSYSPQRVTDRQGFLYRLAFTYLDYAEAVNEAYNTDDARRDAIEYTNRIRERAGVRKYTFNSVSVDDPDYIQIENTQDAVRKVVHMERRVELCCENNRWYDIRRWMAADEDRCESYDYCPGLSGLNEGMDATVTRTAIQEARGQQNPEFCKRVTNWQDPRVWKRQYYFFPVYINEYEKNQNLVQSPFWVNDK